MNLHPSHSIRKTMMTTTRLHADPALELFFEWRKARAAAAAASDALEGCPTADSDGVLSASENAALSAENAIIDRLMTTQAQTPAGALGKSVVLANLAEQGEDPLVKQFTVAILPDLERLLAELSR
jgi:hypothetical protein